jgi:hypothetical protein
MAGAVPAGAGASTEAADHAHLARLAAFLEAHAWLAQCHTAAFFSERAWCAAAVLAPQLSEQPRDRALCCVLSSQGARAGWLAAGAG